MATPASTVALATPVPGEGVRALNFFNGRLLTARDLSLEQQARRDADTQLGQAPGPGIADGLAVYAASGDAPGVVRVPPGVALTRAGSALRLQREQSVQLVPFAEAVPATGQSGFGPCGVLAGSAYATGDGVYLLTLAPSSMPDGRVPVLALDDTRTGCNTDVLVEAVQFRLLKLPNTAAVGTADAAVARLRNSVAYRCFAQTAAATAHAQPGQVLADATATPAHRGVPPGGLLDDLRGVGLSDCDAPLALVYLVAGRVVFVDRWAVRRRVAADAAAPAWAAWLGPRIDALGEARLAQFQEQLAELPAALRTAPVASAWAAFLPPAGFLQTAPGTPVDWRTFLGAQAPAQEMPLNPADAPALLAAALAGDPVPVDGSTRLRVYRLGASGPRLFVRDSRNVHAAEQVWLDGARAGLPGVADVQTALDHLGQGSCLHLVVRANQNPRNVLADLAKQPGRDLTICFEPGRHVLDQPLELADLGRVQIHGHGALLLNPRGTIALRVSGCAALGITGLALASGHATKGKPGDLDTLPGVLTVLDTPEVDLDGVRSHCAAAAVGLAAGIVVRQGSAPKADTAAAPALDTAAAALKFNARLPGRLRGRLRVVQCEVTAGAGQYGIVVVNVGVLLVSGNQIQPDDKGGPLLRAIAVGGLRAGQVHIEGNQVRGALEGISVGGQPGVAPEGEGLRCVYVCLAHNHVELQPDEGNPKQPPFGLFIGDAGGVHVYGNQVQADPERAAQFDLSGLHLRGSFGPQVVVRDNHFDGAAFGMRFAPDLKDQDRVVVWAFQWNVGEGITKEMFDYPSRLKGQVIDDNNLKVD